jgi:hypothetical protein
MNFKMQGLGKYIIKDLADIVKFYLTLRTIDFKNDTEISKIIEISVTPKICYKHKTKHGTYEFIGVTRENSFFYIIYNGVYVQHTVESEKLNDIINFYLSESERIKFYEFQNECVK